MFLPPQCTGVRVSPYPPRSRASTKLNGKIFDIVKELRHSAVRHNAAGLRDWMYN